MYVVWNIHENVYQKFHSVWLFRYTEKYLTIFVVRNRHGNNLITSSLKVSNGTAVEFVKPTE